MNILNIEWQKAVLNKQEVFSRLEFNSDQQAFHYDNYTHEEETFGWVTICKKGGDMFLAKFCLYMDWKYNFSRAKPISLKTIKREFECYCFLMGTKTGLKEENKEINAASK